GRHKLQISQRGRNRWSRGGGVPNLRTAEAFARGASRLRPRFSGADARGGVSVAREKVATLTPRFIFGKLVARSRRAACVRFSCWAQVFAPPQSFWLPGRREWRRSDLRNRCRKSACPG